MEERTFNIPICSLVLGCLLSVITHSLQADVKLPGIFQSHMVLQRDRPLVIWGKADPGEQVRVRIGDLSGTAVTANDSSWRIGLPAMSAGGPYLLHVEGKNAIELADVLVGDVWVCGGQSNMQWRVDQTGYEETDSAFLSTGKVRFFTTHVIMDYMPRTDVSGSGWKRLSRETLQEFSAVGYHFGKFVHQRIEVPVGLISANLGATSVETWMSNDALMAFPQFEPEIGPIAKAKKSFAELEDDFEKYRDAWSKKYYRKGVGITQEWFQPDTDLTQWEEITVAGNTWTEERNLKNHDGAVWFRTTFDLPENFSEKHFLVQLGQIDDYDIAWVNGKKVGETFGKHNHRNYAVPAHDLKPKGNVLVVRVFDAGGIGGFTTSPFWAGAILRGQWIYRKGESIDPKKFKKPFLPNATPFSSPGVLFNGMIAPLTSFPVKGVIWYQGESNAQRAYEYRELFPAMIRDWRRAWNQESLPFLFVQLANYMQEPEEPRESEWAELREAQAMALNLQNTGAATAIDIGEAHDIHPRNKEEVGVRLGKSAMRIAYGDKETVHSGPKFRGVDFNGDGARISFDHTGAGLVSKDKHGYIRGFQIAGADKKFFWARAFIEGDQVVVSSDKVNEPVAVRYAWADNPGPLDLYNSAGLPAIPFRTDRWKGITEGKVFTDGPRF